MKRFAVDIQWVVPVVATLEVEANSAEEAKTKALTLMATDDRFRDDATECVFDLIRDSGPDEVAPEASSEPITIGHVEEVE